MITFIHNIAVSLLVYNINITFLTLFYNLFDNESTDWDNLEKSCGERLYKSKNCILN